jgi:hypothetical protein
MCHCKDARLLELVVANLTFHLGIIGSSSSFLRSRSGGCQLNDTSAYVVTLYKVQKVLSPRP